MLSHRVSIHWTAVAYIEEIPIGEEATYPAKTRGGRETPRRVDLTPTLIES